MIGETIREFEILSELGAGGYGVVYLAQDTSINRKVAIKVILPQYADQPEFIANFEAEARLVAQLEHKDIVPLYTYWHDEQGAFLVMRHIRGGNLRGLLAKQGALPIHRILRIVEQIAEALNVAHENEVIHRDLKPDNILIDERGNAYLTDFGIAKQVNDGHASATDAIKGTFAYLSPEQIEQSRVSPQTDIYAFGVMLYEMLAGQHPFHETPVGMMVVKHLQEPLPNIRDVRPELDSQIVDVIDRATAKDARERYSNTLEFMNAVKEALGASVSIPAVVPATSAPTRKKPTTSAERNRHAMLQNVRSFWVEGVLENSLHETAMIELGMQSETGAVDNPWDTLIRTPGGDEPLMGGQIVDVFDRMNGKLLILGDPGSGKTTTLLALTRELLQRAEVDEQHPIPIVLNLSSWSEKQQPLADWIIEELNVKYQVPRKIAEVWIQEESLLLLLDGLDEVAEQVRSMCVDAINHYRSEHGFVDVVVCSRIVDYEALTIQLKLNGAIVIQPLSDDQIQQYLMGLGADVNIVRDLIARDTQLHELAQTPLMLSIMILAYRGVTAEQVPDFDNVEAQRQHLFDVYVQRMFERHAGEQRYTPQVTRRNLHWLASQMQNHTLSMFNIEDLQPTWLSSPAQVTVFPSQIRTILASFMGIAFLLAGLSWYQVSGGSTLLLPFGYTLVGLFYGFVFGHPWVLGDNWKTRRIVAAVIGLGTGLSFAAGSIAATQQVAVGLFLGLVYGGALGLIGAPFHLKWVKRYRTRTDQVVFLERVQYSRQSIDKKNLIFALMTQTTSALLWGVAMYPDLLNLTLPHILLSALISMVTVIGFNLYMDGFVAGDVGLRLRPNEGFFSTIQTFRHFTLTTILVTICYGVAALAIGAPIEIAFFLWLATALYHGADTILSHGAIPVLQHLWLRYQLERDNNIPRNMAQFLDYASDLILMRKVGGGYIFIHRYLLEYFADQDK